MLVSIWPKPLKRVFPTTSPPPNNGHTPSKLFKGEIHLLLQQFDRYALNDFADYFREHARRMQYAQFRAAGFPIGSGGVESRVKQCKQHLTGPGMRWSRPALDRMVVLRSAVLSQTFDQLGEAA